MYSVDGAGDPWYPGGQVTLMLKEVEMAPALLCRVVYHRRLIAEGTGEGASPGEIEREVQLSLDSIKVYSRHLPWPLNSQCLTEQLLCHTHGFTSESFIHFSMTIPQLPIGFGKEPDFLYLFEELVR